MRGVKNSILLCRNYANSRRPKKENISFMGQPSLLLLLILLYHKKNELSRGCVRLWKKVGSVSGC
ncbi:MAG: hypothetical protein II337_07405 [Clostridia bacterium]|nr:hypothetical protein [Clostridia bacterium]